ncbi:AAA domain-containing protein [Ilyonectria robusta]|uniref:AAA domain-containing protein n=1 Tax=Ilyonectria robusta TaxID=1079257 RepID=UPI001E8DDFB0|nr:AAA domain-containing protein [Ilyonectria robusta]KAH8680355.1 AAA domain-containing protein [Ilyonectria robusta]
MAKSHLRALEAFLKTEYPELKPAPQGELKPVIIYCEGSRCFVDKVKIALDILSSFVKQKQVDPTQLVMITPYKANVEVINKMRQQPGYENLGSMQPAATVESFQGREGDIAIIIMATTKAVGPGFTTDEQRLNVMLSRQRSGLLIVGDINTTGDLKGKGKDKGKGKGKGGKGKGKGDTAHRFQVISASGEKHWVKALMLHNVHSKLYEGGRVINIRVDKTKGEQTQK